MRKDIWKAVYLSGHRIEFAYADGARFELDFWPLIEHSRLLAPLRELADFQAFELGPGGRSLEWPQFDLGFCADALWLDGHPAELARVEAAALHPVGVH